MATLTDSTNLTGTITLSKATGTKVVLDTDKKYLTKDIELTINAPTTTATANGATVSYGTGWITGGSTTVTDANLIAANIKKNVSIFGVTGTYEGNSILVSDTIDANGGTIRTITTTADPIMVQEKANITPGTTATIVTPDSGYTGLTKVTVNGDSNLIASNIKSGVSIFGVTGTASSGTPSSYTRTVICPQQTVTASSSNRTAVLNNVGQLIDGEQYVVTFDNVEWFGTCETLWGGETLVVGDVNVWFGTDADHVYPFSVGYAEQDNESGIEMCVYSAGQHTVKVEHIELLNEGTSLITKTITSNGTYSASNDNADGYSSITVNVENTSSLQAKTNITPTTSSQTIRPDSGYDGLSSVQINAMPSGSVTVPSSISGTAATVSTGSNTITLTKSVSVTPNVTTAGYISTGTAGNSSVSLTASVTVNPTPTASGATVTIPAGYYSSQTTKSVTSGSATGPSTVSSTGATVSTGTNTITLTKTNVTTTPTVSAGYVSSATTSTGTVTLTASVTTKAAATITPGTSNQTIASGTYLTGTQTIAGDADLVASNIISTANIFGVQGSVVINKYYTGSNAPSSNLGNDGDIYLQQAQE